MVSKCWVCCKVVGHSLSCRQVEKHREQLACLMVTYPSTHGVFDNDIQLAFHISACFLMCAGLSSLFTDVLVCLPCLLMCAGLSSLLTDLCRFFSPAYPCVLVCLHCLLMCAGLPPLPFDVYWLASPTYWCVLAWLPYLLICAGLSPMFTDLCWFVFPAYRFAVRMHSFCGNTVGRTSSDVRHQCFFLWFTNYCQHLSW